MKRLFRYALVTFISWSTLSAAATDPLLEELLKDPDQGLVLKSALEQLQANQMELIDKQVYERNPTISHPSTKTTYYAHYRYRNENVTQLLYLTFTKPESLRSLKDLLAVRLLQSTRGSAALGFKLMQAIAIERLPNSAAANQLIRHIDARGLAVETIELFENLDPFGFPGPNSVDSWVAFVNFVTVNRGSPRDLRERVVIPFSNDSISITQDIRSLGSYDYMNL